MILPRKLNSETAVQSSAHRFLESCKHAHTENIHTEILKNSAEWYEIYSKAQLKNCGSELCATVSSRVIHMPKVKIYKTDLLKNSSKGYKIVLKAQLGNCGSYLCTVFWRVVHMLILKISTRKYYLTNKPTNHLLIVMFLCHSFWSFERSVLFHNILKMQPLFADCCWRFLKMQINPTWTGRGRISLPLASVISVLWGLYLWTPNFLSTSYSTVQFDCTMCNCNCMMCNSFISGKLHSGNLFFKGSHKYFL